MITVIRNDRDARYAHDVYGIKIKEDLPLYKVIGTTRNEGICLYESPNYAAIAQVFDHIVEAMSNGDKTVLIIPPMPPKLLTKEEYFDQCAVHDFRHFSEEEPIRRTEDLYGRPLNENHLVNELPQPYRPEYYNWNRNEKYVDNLQKNSFDNRYLNNTNPYMG